jgi:hypothetical protein
MTRGFGFLVLAFLFGGCGQTQTSREPTPAEAKQQTATKDSPTLGFTHIKDLFPIMDTDCFNEEQRLKKELPGNQAVPEKCAMHETILLNEFVEGFKNSEECNGITIYLITDKKSEFTVQVGVSGHDEPKPSEQSWTWILIWPGDPSPAAKESHGMGGMGSQPTAKLAARDVCMTVWDDLDPNHFKKPGGRIE